MSNFFLAPDDYYGFRMSRKLEISISQYTLIVIKQLVGREDVWFKPGRAENRTESMLPAPCLELRGTEVIMITWVSHLCKRKCPVFLWSDAMIIFACLCLVLTARQSFSFSVYCWVLSVQCVRGWENKYWTLLNSSI